MPKDQFDRTQEKRRKALSVLADKLRQDEHVQNRRIKTWLTDDEYSQFETAWGEQKVLRNELNDKPSELTRYEDKLKAVQAEATVQGLGVLRWITRDNNYREHGLYDKLAQKTDWKLYEMTAT